jgi:hypothetical protein
MKPSTEQSLWIQITKDLTCLLSARTQNDHQSKTINKAHKKVESREASNEAFTVKAGLRLQEIYNQSMDCLENEINILNKTIDRIDVLINIQENNYHGFNKIKKEESRKKRKSMDAKLESCVKKLKFEEKDILNLQRGAKVAAKIGQEWILAVVVGPVNRKIEIEVENF